MNKFIIGFVFIVLVSRFFTETLSIAPKALDLIDFAVIPLLFLLAAGTRSAQGADLGLHRRFLHFTVAFISLCILSAAINYDRVHLGPWMLYVFGLLEGPILFLSLNKLITDKKQFGMTLVRFISMMLVIEMLVVLFVSYPSFLIEGNPDKMSGTFGNNSYQFTVLLIIIGGFLIGKQVVTKRRLYYVLAAQFFIIITFVLLQYRTATPAFFLAYIILVLTVFGQRFIRVLVIAAPILLLVYIGYQYVNLASNTDLKYRDLLALKDDIDSVLGKGKAQAYVETMEMYSDEPTTILFGSGPGTFVSRACYTFTTELRGKQDKGVGPIVTAIFGDKDFGSDVYYKHVKELSEQDAMYGSDQINNPNSSVLAIAAETGIPGLIIMLCLYGVLVSRSFRFLRYALATRDPGILPLASALAISVTYLCLIAPLDNYLEIARVTIPIWLLFWAVSNLVHQQRTEHLARYHYQAMMRYNTMLEQEHEEREPSRPFRPR